MDGQTLTLMNSCWVFTNKFLDQILNKTPNAANLLGVLDTKGRFHVAVRTQINKFVFYFIVRRNVKFGCSEC